MKQNYQAIILDKKDIAETDRLYIIYTQEEGLLTVPARGVRKSQAKLAAQVEVFNFSNITIAKNRGRGALTGAVLENNFQAIKNHYLTLQEVYRVRAIFLKMIYGQEADSHIFQLFLQYLKLINQRASKEVIKEDEIIWLTNSFLFKLYYLQGYTFRFLNCQECKKTISHLKNNFFSASSGGIVCHQCAKKIKFQSLMNVNTIKALRLIVQNDLKNLAKVQVDQLVNNQMTIITKDVLRWVMR
jgi:DNA repair protein RecO (recombination protein O)